jgi:hypothetical protein
MSTRAGGFTDREKTVAFWCIGLPLIFLILIATAWIEPEWAKFLLTAALAFCVSRVLWWVASERTAWFYGEKAGEDDE